MKETHSELYSLSAISVTRHSRLQSLGSLEMKILRRQRQY